MRVALNGEDGTPGAGGERVVTRQDVILATGSRVKSLPGLVPDGNRIITSDDVTTKADLPRGSRSSARARSGPSSPRCTTTWASRDAARIPAGGRPARRP